MIMITSRNEGKFSLACSDFMLKVGPPKAFAIIVWSRYRFSCHYHNQSLAPTAGPDTKIIFFCFDPS